MNYERWILKLLDNQLREQRKEGHQSETSDWTGGVPSEQLINCPLCRAKIRESRAMRHMSKVHDLGSPSELKKTLETVERRRLVQERIDKIKWLCHRIEELMRVDIQDDLEFNLSHEEAKTLESILQRAQAGTERLSVEKRDLSNELKSIKKSFFKRRVKV